MLPTGTDDEEQWSADFEIETEPSLTYAMQVSDMEEKEGLFIGKIDEEAALKQAVMKILNTERYASPIYSWDYGVEFSDLRGMPLQYVMSAVKSRITDALLADDRIAGVEDFVIERSGRKALHVRFTVLSEQDAEINVETEVDIS